MAIAPRDSVLGRRGGVDRDQLTLCITAIAAVAKQSNGGKADSRG